MIEEQFGSSDAYFSIFKALQRDRIFDRQFALLQAHYDAPNHTVTWAQLAEIVGYANGSAVNLQYGMLAKRVAHWLGYTVSFRQSVVKKKKCARSLAVALP